MKIIDYLAIVFSWINKNNTFVTAISALGSFTTALVSFLIAYKVYNYTRKKEALNIILAVNRTEIGSIDESNLETLVSNLKFKVSNPSIISTNSLQFDMVDIINTDKEKLFETVDKNPELSTLGGSPKYDPIIYNFQSHDFQNTQNLDNIANGETVEINLPKFIIDDLLQASFLMNDDIKFKYKRKFKLKIHYFHKQKHKMKVRTKKIKYFLEHEGARLIINFKINPVSIRLFK